MENNEVKFDEIRQQNEKKEKKSFGKKVLDGVKTACKYGLPAIIGCAGGYVLRRYVDKKIYEAAGRQFDHERRVAERNNNN